MKDAIIEHVKKLLAEGVIDGFLALQHHDEHIGPHLFSGPGELSELNLGEMDLDGDARYPLIKTLTKLVNRFPDKTFGILVRGCDERALYRRYHDDRVHPLNPRQVVPVGFSCSEWLAKRCQCAKPWPDALVAGEKTPGVTIVDDPDEDLFARLDEWFHIMDRCVKCFGCRNSCPVCSCLECTMEAEAFVPQKQLPIDKNFLFTRANHMIDRCVYCGLCEEACPADIPLKDLYRLVAKVSGGGYPLPVPQAAPDAPQEEAS
jgi:formate dehydrogenase subunit beta